MTERNDQTRKVTLVRGKLFCSCNDDIFTGIPFRHLLAIATKDPSVEFINLVVNRRWRIDYYVENEELQDPQEFNLSLQRSVLMRGFQRLAFSYFEFIM